MLKIILEPFRFEEEYADYRLRGLYRLKDERRLVLTTTSQLSNCLLCPSDQSEIRNKLSVFFFFASANIKLRLSFQPVTKYLQDAKKQQT